MSREDLKIGQVRYYAESGEVTDEWRVIQEFLPGGNVAGGGVFKTDGGEYYVWPLSSGSWSAKLVGDLIMTWSQVELDKAIALGL